MQLPSTPKTSLYPNATIDHLLCMLVNLRPDVSHRSTRSPPTMDLDATKRPHFTLLHFVEQNLLDGPLLGDCIVPRKNYGHFFLRENRTTFFRIQSQHPSHVSCHIPLSNPRHQRETLTLRLEKAYVTLLHSKTGLSCLLRKKDLRSHFWKPKQRWTVRRRRYSGVRSVSMWMGDGKTPSRTDGVGITAYNPTSSS